MRCRRSIVAMAFTTASIVVGCGGALPAASSGGSVSAATAQATAPASPSPSVTPPTALTYVAFGDSWPYGAHCNGCRPFPVLLQAGFQAAAAGREVRFLNDVTNGGTAQELAQAMRTDPRIRADIAAADIVVIATGGNDMGPAFDATTAGTCGGADRLDCFRRVRDVLRVAYDAMLSEVDQLRSGKPTAVRMVTTSNEFLADPDLIEVFGSDFGRTGGVEVTKMNRDAQCDVAALHHAKCIDLGAALNGPKLTVPRDVNTQDAMQKVADAILAAGLPELDL
jgi:lysophospholipase L1-like esterase